jgi:hypothetical protein
MKKTMVPFVMGLGLLSLGPGPAFSQTHKVAAKPETVVRAIGVYEWTGDLAKPTGSRFVPVTVFIDGELEDAGIYKPQPVPFALLSGNIYELEDAGLSKGTVVLESALHAIAPEGAPGPVFDAGWTAYGDYKAPATSTKKSTSLKPSKNMPVIAVSGGDSSKPHLSDKSADQKSSKTSTDDPDRPTMHRRTGSDTSSGTGSDKSTTGTDKSGTTSGSSTKTDSGTGTTNTGNGTSNTSNGTPNTSNGTSNPNNGSPNTSTTSTDNDPDRPTMHRRSVSDDTASNGDSSGDNKQDSSDDAERPTLKRRSPEEAKQEKKQKEVATVTGGGSLNDDPDRPRLHHGGSGSGEDSEAPKLMGVPKDMHQMVAVSDAKNRDPHPFARPWEDTSERTAILAKMQAFAREKLTAYGVVPGVTPPTAIAGTSAGVAKSGAPVNLNDAPDSGPPTLKRGIPSKSSVTAPPVPAKSTPAPTAKAAPAASAKTTPKTTAAHAKARHGAAAPAPLTLADEDLRSYTLSYGGAPTYVYMAHTVETGSVMRYITIVAQDNGMGELKVAMANATDAAHLDRTPWMRLVDVVDVEASNRASLLFELRGQNSRQFSLYRVIAAKPEQIFLTGNGM